MPASPSSVNHRCVCFIVHASDAFQLVAFTFKSPLHFFFSFTRYAPDVGLNDWLAVGFGQ